MGLSALSLPLVRILAAAAYRPTSNSHQTIPWKVLVQAGLPPPHSLRFLPLSPALASAHTVAELPSPAPPITNLPLPFVGGQSGTYFPPSLPVEGIIPNASRRALRS